MTPSAVKPAIWNWLLVLVAVAAFGLRVARLDQRPMHHDEANQAVRAGILQETGEYRYDPVEHHGPALYYLTAPLLRLFGGNEFSGTTETMFRIVPAIFGTGLILLLLGLADGLGRPATLIAAILTACSPAMAYYSRYFVHEMTLAFLTLACIAAFWRWTRTGTRRWLMTAALMAGLMFATKETCIIAFFSMAVAWLLSGASRETRLPLPRPTLMVLAILTSFAVVVLFYSSFFIHPDRIVEAFTSYRSYLVKGTTVGVHAHPWTYYWHLLGWYHEGRGPVFSEALILVLAAVGAVAILLRRLPEAADPALLRFLLVYTTLMSVIYSAIPHKSPWLVLSFLNGLILLAGIGAVTVMRLFSGRGRRIAAGLVLAAAITQLALQAVRCCFRYDCDPRNPYAYVHTSRDFLKLANRIEAVASHDQLIAVVTNVNDAWPLPWYLRKFKQVGYWPTLSALPDGVKPAVIVTSMDKDQELAGYLKEYYGLRPGVLLALHIRNDLWDAFIARQENAR